MTWRCSGVKRARPALIWSSATSWLTPPKTGPEVDLGRIVERDLDRRRPAAHRVDQAVVRDPKHPCRERGALGLERVDFLVHAREDVGGQILGLFGVAVEALKQVAKDARRVALVQLVKSLGVVGADAAHQVFGIRDG